MTFDDLWSGVAALGRGRPAFRAAELSVRRWFRHQAGRRGFRVVEDAHGNLAATWRVPMLQFTAEVAPQPVVVGSHVDAAAGEPAEAGLLGIAAAFAAIDLLRERGFAPARPVTVVGFSAGTGSRFGERCLGSRLALGELSAAEAAGLVDSDGLSWPEALAMAEVGAGVGAGVGGAEELPWGTSTPPGISAFVELHLDDSEALAARGLPIGVAARVWARGSFRLEFTPAAADERPGASGGGTVGNPLLTCAVTALAADKVARRAEQWAVMERVEALPGVGRPRQVVARLDVRAPQRHDVDALLAEIMRYAEERAARDGTRVQCVAEEFVAGVEFSPGLASWLAGEHFEGDWPLVDARQHRDASVWARAGVPSALLLVRATAAEGGLTVSAADRQLAVDAVADSLTRLAR